MLKTEKREIRHGFLIEGCRIYDTKIQCYNLKKEVVGNNIICYMEPSYYKRLHLFEPLLEAYPHETVFKILHFNRYLRKQRSVMGATLEEKTKFYMHTLALIDNYPPTFLTRKRFEIYKKVQRLKTLIE